MLCSVTEKNSDAIGILWDITGMVLRGRACAQEGMCDDVMGMPLAVFWPMEMEGSLGISKNNLPTSSQLLGATNCPKGVTWFRMRKSHGPPESRASHPRLVFFSNGTSRVVKFKVLCREGVTTRCGGATFVKFMGDGLVAWLEAAPRLPKNFQVLPAPLGSCDVGPVPWEDYRTMTTTTE